MDSPLKLTYLQVSYDMYEIIRFPISTQDLISIPLPPYGLVTDWVSEN